MKLLGEMEFTYTIIDSDATSNLQLQHILEEYGYFKCVAQAKNSTEGLNTILKYSPDIAFVNLHDNAESAFRLAVDLHQFDNKVPILIALSKTKEYAYEAIKASFFDYWMLPFDEFDIRKSLLRLKKIMPKEDKPQTLCLKSYQDFQYLNTDDILYLQADNNTTEFIMKDGTVNNAFKTLKTFENQMPPNFLRIHQSYIVNVNYISGISYGKGYCSLKLRKLELPFSKSYRENINELKKLLTKNTISTLN